MRASVVIIVAALMTLGAGYYGYRATGRGAQAPPYKTATVDRGTLVSTVTAIGTVEPILRVLVGSQVSGTAFSGRTDANAGADAFLGTIPHGPFPRWLAGWRLAPYKPGTNTAEVPGRDLPVYRWRLY